MTGKNKAHFSRYVADELTKVISGGKSCLFFGPRQTGKTTLVHKTLENISNKKDIIEYPLQHPGVRQSLEADPGKLIREVEAYSNKPIVFIDEAQKVPSVFDAAQYLIDTDKASIILTGSSARKLRRSGANLLPGRVSYLHLDPLMWGELGLLRGGAIDELKVNNINKSKFSLEDSLVFGSLPNIVLADEQDRSKTLREYAEIYLEEEIRAEALSRNVGAFSRFLELAARESGTAPNMANLSQETGVSQPAIKEFYNILVDTLVAERVDPYLKKPRKQILSSSRYYLFDIGVRNAVARLPLTHDLINAQKGTLFEHAVILEIIRRIRALDKNYKVNYWRTKSGAEVDCIIDMGDKVIPIEIKASKNVSLGKLKGLKIFLEDYKSVAKEGFVITMGERREKLAHNITAIPWQEL